MRPGQHGAGDFRQVRQRTAQPPQVLLAHAADRQQRALDDRAADVEHARVALRKRASGEVQRGDGQRVVVERAEIFAQDFDLLELAGGRGDGVADPGKRGELGWLGVRLRRGCRRSASAGAAGAISPRGGRGERHFHLVLLAQAPTPRRPARAGRRRRRRRSRGASARGAA